MLAKQHCDGKDVTIKTNDVRVFAVDGTFEIKPDYSQRSAQGERLHGLKFCKQYELNPRALPSLKSSDEIRKEFAARRAASKAAAKIRKAEDDAKKKKIRQAKILAQKIDAAQHATESVVDEPEVIITPVAPVVKKSPKTQAVNYEQLSSSYFDDLII